MNLHETAAPAAVVQAGNTPGNVRFLGKDLSLIHI